MKSKNSVIVLLQISLLVLMIGIGFSSRVQAVKGSVFTENSTYYKTEGYYVFTGNPRLEYKDYIITADTIEYYEKEDRATFEGNVVVLQGETKIHADSMEADLNTDAFEIEGNVDIYYVRKSKGDSGNQKKEIILIDASHVTFYGGDDDHLIARDQVTMEVDDQIIHSEYLEYISADDLVFARDDVEVIGEDEETLLCQEFTYRLEGEEEGFSATGGVELEFTIDDEETTDSPASEQPVTNDSGGA